MPLRDLRNSWITWIETSDFRAGTGTLAARLEEHVGLHENGLDLHLASCGAIPERLRHDSSEEKLYSKYTDELLALAFRKLGVHAQVLDARADSADVHGRTTHFSFVADAKAFRLSRTAKNQKDFKVQAMVRWRGDAGYAVVVAPMYQVPRSSSQIYRQAIEGGVAIASYAHMIALLRMDAVRRGSGVDGLERLLSCPAELDAAKSAQEYWAAVRRAVTNDQPVNIEIWRDVLQLKRETLATMKSLEIEHLHAEAVRIRSMSHEEAVTELLNTSKIAQRARSIESVRPTDVFEY